MSKKKDKNKPPRKYKKIELKEISAEQTAALVTPLSRKLTVKSSMKKPSKSVNTSTEEAETNPSEEIASAPKQGCRIRVLPMLTGKNEDGYEEKAAAILNETIAEGYELVSIVPSANAKKIIAFLRLASLK